MLLKAWCIYSSWVYVDRWSPGKLSNALHSERWTQAGFKAENETTEGILLFSSEFMLKLLFLFLFKGAFGG